ncbi:LCP family protein [Streptomyces sp. XD-27]|uniref:LCP family protein n=1 Tax=Streptomyces sp. XD-27 TaxID=3062779 RepID=UPI0026F42AAC|nr:LCP family protein [Streptomyces sp. XD-27]WKX70705.1 LCP family protein [Streptomyces sp. XD-27]
MGQESRLHGQGRRRRTPVAQEAGPSGAGAGSDGYEEPPGGGSGEPVRRPVDGGPGPDRTAVPGPRTGGSGPGGRRRRRGPRKQRSKGVRILKWTALSLAVLILAAAGAGYLYYQHLNGNIRKEDRNLGDSDLERSAPNADGQRPLNILLLGSDSRNSKDNVKLGGARHMQGDAPRADVQMLLHVSADRSNMSVISIPRDTRVKIPKCTAKDGTVYPETTSQTINNSMQNGGPGCTVAAWQELTGIYIDHFMKIEFSGVVDMADAVGGVPVCVKDNVYDKDSGLRMEKGDHEVKGEQALQWLRTRHGFEDGSDIGRAKAQHMYMSAMVRQLKSGTKLTDPGKLMDLAEAATKALTVDPGLGTVKKLYDLGNDLKRVPTKRITMTTMPWIPDPQDDDHVIPKPGDADKVFSLVRDDIALDGKDKKKPKSTKAATPKPSAPKDEIAVTVQNGTGTTALGPVPQRARTIADTLVQNGFAKATADTTPTSQADTTVTYPKAELQGDALAVAKALGLPASAVRMSTSVTQVTLVVGADWREGTAYPKPADGGGDASKDDGKAPSMSEALNGDDKDACMKVNPLNRF